MKVLRREEAPNVLRAKIKRLKKQMKHHGYRPVCDQPRKTGLVSFMNQELVVECGAPITHMGLNGPRCAECIKKERHALPIFEV